MTLDLPASFYLGRTPDAAGTPLHYPARDLTTHAVIIGMTGSGKTGLGISLLEEAALDGIPALIIDPKGDMTNLLLNFPDLRADDFLPWVEPAPGASPLEEAQRTAERWRTGLAQWGIDGTRMRQLRDAAEFAIYTPGSEAGRAVNMLDAWRRPAGAWDADAENQRERVQGIVSALLGLVGIEADPLRSREHILLSSVLEHAWRAGQELDLGALILSIQDPPLRKLGVFDLDSFFPPKERYALAMALNAILAAPSFEAWRKGEPFDIAALLRPPAEAGAKARVRHVIFSIAHLGDAERFFFVTLLLEQVRVWMHAQSGTGSLRALLYFDELFGYLPPHPRNPSTKTPLLYLLKNARAFGLGLVLATQNPIDLDYKALSNAGTWFIGKLQTQFDKARLLEGLQTAAGESGAALDREQLNDEIGTLAPRMFVYHNIHAPPPILFHSRWAMSYLKGPLTRPQIRELMRGQTMPAAVPTGAAPASSAATIAPQLSPEVAQFFLPPATAAPPAGEAAVYQPYLLGIATVTFDDRRTGTRHSVQYARLLAPARGVPSDWHAAEALPLAAKDLLSVPPPNARFADLPNGFAEPRTLAAQQKTFVQYLYGEARLVVRRNRALKIVENPAASDGDFRQRCAEAARAALDAARQAIKTRTTRQLERLAARLQKAQASVSAERQELDARKHEELWTNIESVAAFLGLGRAYRPLSTASRRRRLTDQSRQSIAAGADTIAELERQLAELRQAMDAELESARAQWVAAQDDIEQFQLVPRKSDIHVDAFGIAWRAEGNLGAGKP